MSEVGVEWSKSDGMSLAITEALSTTRRVSLAASDPCRYGTSLSKSGHLTALSEVPGAIGLRANHLQRCTRADNLLVASICGLIPNPYPPRTLSSEWDLLRLLCGGDMTRWLSLSED